MLAITHRMMLPSRQQKEIGTSEKPVSQLNTQPMVSPVNASRQPSRTAAHHSGPERLARPYSAVDFHLLSFASLSWRSPLLAISRPTRAASVRPLHLHKPTSGRPLSSLDLIGQVCLERAFFRTLVASVLYRQIAVVDQSVDDGAGCVDVEVL